MNLKSFMILIFHEILKEGTLMLFMSILVYQLLLWLLLRVFNLNNDYVVIRP